MGVRLTSLIVNAGTVARDTRLWAEYCSWLLALRLEKKKAWFQWVARVMRGLNHCEGLQGQYGHKLERDLNHIQSQHKSVTPNHLWASSAKATALNLNNDTLKMFNDDQYKASWYDQQNKIQRPPYCVCMGSSVSPWKITVLSNSRHNFSLEFEAQWSL